MRSGFYDGRVFRIRHARFTAVFYLCFCFSLFGRQSAVTLYVCGQATGAGNQLVAARSADSQIVVCSLSVLNIHLLTQIIRSPHEVLYLYDIQTVCHELCVLFGACMVCTAGRDMRMGNKASCAAGRGFNLPGNVKTITYRIDICLKLHGPMKYLICKTKILSCT